MVVVVVVVATGVVLTVLADAVVVMIDLSVVTSGGAGLAMNTCSPPNSLATPFPPHPAPVATRPPVLCCALFSLCPDVTFVWSVPCSSTFHFFPQ